MAAEAMRFPKQVAIQKESYLTQGENSLKVGMAYVVKFPEISYHRGS